MHGQEIPAVIGDKFDIDFTIDASHIFCNPIRTTALASTFHMEISEIDIYIFYYALTEEQRRMFLEQRNSGGLTFVYRVFSTEAKEADSNALYQNTKMASPSAILLSSVTMYTN